MQSCFAGYARAIRTVNPAARLIHTDDYGKTFGTRQMAELVEFSNIRRWLGLDLLFGRVREDHPMWRYLLENGITEDDLQEFMEVPCPPDVLGINFYITSERFYDHRLDRYPAQMQSQEQGKQYVNLDVSRILVEGMSGYETLLPEVWERYGKPMAITEIHIGSLRDEDLRWLWYIWQEAQRVRERGIEVQTVTMWALLGTYNWASLLTKDSGQYEPGAFDVRAPQPRPTALVRLAQDLSAGRQPDIPVLDTPGWWKRWERLEYPPFRLQTQSDYVGARLTHEPGPTGRPILIVGGGGQLGRCFLRMCTQRGLSWRTLLHSELDIADPLMLENALNLLHPWAVINTAGLNNPDTAQQHPEWAKQVLSDGPAILAAACAARNIPLVTFSSDQVFDGKKKDKYVESDPTNPLSVFGRYLAEGEERALTIWPQTLVMRIGVHFSPYEDRNPVTHALNALAAGQPFTAADDCTVTGTYTLDLCNDTLDLLIDQEVGIWHHAHPQAMTLVELYRLAAHITGIDASKLKGRPMAELGLLAPRPLYSALGSERGVLPPPLEQALARYCTDCQVGWVTQVAEEDRCRNAPESPKMG